MQLTPMASKQAPKSMSVNVPTEEERRNPLRDQELEDPATPPAAHAQAVPEALAVGHLRNARDATPQVLVHVAAEAPTPVDGDGALRGNFAPSFCGINRRGLKITATITSLCALAVYSIAVAPKICHHGCTRGLLLLVVLLSVVSIISCSGLCVTARRHDELGESAPYVCGCQRKDHDIMSWACFIGALFFFLGAFAAYTWAYAMFTFMLFFCIVGAVGCGGIWGTRPARVDNVV